MNTYAQVMKFLSTMKGYVLGSKAGQPSTTDIAQGFVQPYKDTGGGPSRMYVNDGGTIGLIGGQVSLLHNSAATIGLNNPGSTAETKILTVEIPGGFLGINGLVEIEMMCDQTNSANNKILRWYHNSTDTIGGNNFASDVSTTVAAYRQRFFLGNVADQAVQIGGLRGTSNGSGSSGTALQSGAIATTGRSYLILTMQLATGTERMQAKYVSVKGLRV